MLDEPGASLDPLARRGFLADLMGLVAEHGPTVVLSSHLLSEIERVCDHIVVMVGGRVALQGDIDELLATHWVLTGPRLGPRSFIDSDEVVDVSHTDRQTTMLVRTRSPLTDPRWTVTTVGLEDLVLAYLSGFTPPDRPVHVATVRS